MNWNDPASHDGDMRRNVESYASVTANISRNKNLNHFWEKYRQNVHLIPKTLEKDAFYCLDVVLLLAEILMPSISGFLVSRRGLQKLEITFS